MSFTTEPEVHVLGKGGGVGGEGRKREGRGKEKWRENKSCKPEKDCTKCTPEVTLKRMGSNRQLLHRDFLDQGISK